MIDDSETNVMRSIFLPVAMDTELREVACRTGRTKASLVREALEVMLSSLRTRGTTPGAGWNFYHNGKYGPADERTLRDFSRSLSIYSCDRGVASVVMEQQWGEIDRLRARVAELERPEAG